MGMVNSALVKFYEKINKKTTNEVFFRDGNMEYQICYCGHYIITENTDTEYSEEYCFKENGAELIEAFLNAKVDETKSKTIRELISKLSPDDLIITK